MKAVFVVIAILFLISCWGFVVGHQLGVDAFRGIDSQSLVAAVIPIAYPVTGLSVAMMIAAAVVVVFRK